MDSGTVIKVKAVHDVINAFEHEICLLQAGPITKLVSALCRYIERPLCCQPVRLLATTVDLFPEYGKYNEKNKQKRNISMLRYNYLLKNRFRFFNADRNWNEMQICTCSYVYFPS